MGEAGQARLRDSEVVLGSRGLAAVVATRYAAGAGFGALRVGTYEATLAAAAVDPAVRVRLDETIVAPGVPSWLALDDAAARAVAEGAYEALVAVRSRLRLEGKTS